MTRSSRLMLVGLMATVLSLGTVAGTQVAAPGAASAAEQSAACTAAQQKAAKAGDAVSKAQKRRAKARDTFNTANQARKAQPTAAHAKAAAKAQRAKKRARRDVRAARAVRAEAAAVMAAACAATPPPPTVPGTSQRPTPTRPADPIAHDPTVVREGDWFYLAITGDAATGRDYLPMKRSRDLLTWEQLPPVFTQIPDAVLAAIGATQADAPRDAWAPDLSWTGTEWRLYYSVSRFGTTNSVTALMSTKSLDPASPDFGWVDRGIVLETEALAPNANTRSTANAIDANYVQDAEGGAWLTYGSFFAGIQLIELDPATGKLAAGAQPQTIATRPQNFNPLEGPSIIRNGDYYYLFVAFDYCCRGAESDYRVMVGRSTSIQGPYVDQAGLSMLEGGGTEVLRGYNEFQGTGHPDTFSDGGIDYLVNHYYDALDDPTPRANVRTISWAGGWPTVSEPANPSRWVGRGSAYVQVVPRGATAVVGAEGCGYATADLRLASPTGDTCQQWQIDARDARTVTDGSETGSRFQNRNANMAADFPDCGIASLTAGNVEQFDWLGNFFYNVCQRWTFSAAADGYTTITSIARPGPQSLVWTTAGLAPGANLGTALPTGATNQQFRFQPVGEVLLGGVDRTQTLGVAGCRAGRGNGDRVGLQTRSTEACQTWTVTSAGGAGYTVTNAAAGRRLASTGCIDGSTSDELELVSATGASTACSTWTLQPDDNGTWSLTAAGRTQKVRLLIP